MVFLVHLQAGSSAFVVSRYFALYFFTLKAERTTLELYRLKHRRRKYHMVRSRTQHEFVGLIFTFDLFRARSLVEWFFVMVGRKAISKCKKKKKKKRKHSMARTRSTAWFNLGNKEHPLQSGLPASMGLFTPQWSKTKKYIFQTAN